MKKLSRLKLNHLSGNDLQKREMNAIKGGACCVCGCRGSSSSYWNGTANVAGGYTPADGGPGTGGSM